MSTLSVTLKNPADTTNAHFEFNLKIYKECTTKELISEVYPFFENTVSIRFRFNWSSNVKIYVQLKSLNGVTSILLLTGDDLIVENIQTDCYSWLLISDFYYNCNKLLVITQMSLHLNIPSRGRIQFKELYKDKEFTDFELFGEDNEVEAVPVHRNVLAVSSPVLKSMLLGDWKEAKQGHVQVSGVSIVTLQQFKEFIYLKQIPKEPLDYAKLYILASYYMLNDLTELENGVDLIRKNFNSKNVWDWLEYCVQQKNDKLLLMRLTYNNIDDLANDLFYPRETDSHYFFYLKKQKKTNSQDIKLSNNYKDLYDDVDFTDFELRLESEDAAVPVHRNVLAVNSPVLQKMFLEDWKDTKQGYVKIPNISIATTTIQQFKDYIYLKKVPNDASDCFKLFPFAAHFMMPELERDAAIKIANDLKPENVWDYFERCVQYKSHYLLLALLRNILDEDKIGRLEEYFAKL